MTADRTPPIDRSRPPIPTVDAPSRIGRILVVATLAVMLLMWAWIWLFAPRDNPDRFRDSAYAAAAEPVCAAAQLEIRALPSGQQTPDVAERAAVVRTGTEIVERMVAELEALAPLVADPDDRATLEAWFDDWHELYLADRWDHVERLESAGPDTPDESLAFLVQDLRYGRRIDGLANVNEMESCVLPGDI